ncbi:unnamed protein product [Caenorhabditis brenneri]
MQGPFLREQPPRAAMSSSSNSDYHTSTTGTTRSTLSVTHPSDTKYGLNSLDSDCSNEAIGSELTAEEAQWLKLAHEFTAAEKPFKEQKSFRVARKLRTWHPRRGVTWTFLRRLYNGRQDMKEEDKLEADLAEMQIKERE